MTGITAPGVERPRKDVSPTESYQTLKKAPERYSIIQFGVSLFEIVPEQVPQEANEDGEIAVEPEEPPVRPEWSVRKYNFYTFPDKDSDRDVCMSPGAIDFLNGFNMSFDQWIKKGTPYVTTDQAMTSLAKYVVRQTRADQEAQERPIAPTIQQASRRVELRRNEDIEFFSRCMASLREWLDSPAPNPDPAVPEGTCFLLPECNSFLRRAFYEAIEQEYPSLVLEKAGPENPNRIRVWRLDDEEKQRRDQRMRREGWEHVITQKVGLARIFLALSFACRGLSIDPRSVLFAPSIDSVDWTLPPMATLPQLAPRKIPLVVHNGFMDLTFLMCHFVQPILPPALADCKKMILSYFPSIYDTKVLATECSTTHPHENTALGPLFARTSQNMNLLERLDIVAPQGADAPADQMHEAAYDAFMTGVAYIGLCNEIQQKVGMDLVARVGSEEAGATNIFARNKLYQMSMYTMDLENSEQDPMSRGMLVEATCRVSDIDPAVSTRDIVRALSNLMDSEGRRIAYEIVWVDDTTFLVAASYQQALIGRFLNESSSGPDIVRDHGKFLIQALRARFGEKFVTPLDDYFASLSAVTADPGDAPKPSIVSRIAGVFGFGSKRKAAAEEDGEPSTKRRRMN
jgi:poly(A)-specific ribonuclease